MSEAWIDPDKARFSRFKDLPREGVIHMLNLIKLNDRAVYEEGRECSGAEAYTAYGKMSGPVFRRLGGRIVWSGDFELMLIGPESEKWDICFIAEYPNAEAFIAMLRDPDYRQAVKHRQAAVKTSRLIRLSPKSGGAGFG